MERILGWDFSISADAVTLALGLSVAAGGFFWLHPAWKATRLGPRHHPAAGLSDVGGKKEAPRALEVLP